MSSVVDGDDIPDSDPDPSPEDNVWTRITDRSECRSAMKELKDKMNYLLDDIDDYVAWAKNRLIQDKFANYSKFLDYMFPNDTFNATSVPSHLECLGLKNEVIEMDDLFLLITELGWNISRSLSYDEAYRYAVQIPPLYKKRKLYDESYIYDFDYKVRETCNWLKNWGEESKDAGEKALDDFDKIMDERNAALRHFETVSRLFNRLHDKVFNRILPALTLAHYYLEGNVTKLTLSETFETTHFHKEVEALSDLSDDLVEVTNAYTDAMIKGRDKFEDMYEKMLNLKLPVLNLVTVNSLELVKQAAEINDPLVKGLVQGLKENPNDVIELVKDMYNRVMDPTASLIEPVNDVVKRTEPLADNLKEYKTSTKMNTEFFM